MLNVNFKGFETYGESDLFFNVEINFNGEVQNEIMAAESVAALVRRASEVSYDEEVAGLEQALENAEMGAAEVVSEQGEYDVYFHAVSVGLGEVSYDVAGKFIKTFKTEKAAVRKAEGMANFLI